MVLQKSARERVLPLRYALVFAKDRGKAADL